MEVELVDHSLLHFLMQNEETVGFDVSIPVLECLWHMAINVDDRTVHTVASEIGNIVFAVELLDAPHDGVERALQH
jgi:hypothetical protein